MATENAVPQPPRIQGDNKDDMILYGQVEGEGLNGAETYEDPDVEVKVHTKNTKQNRYAYYYVVSTVWRFGAARVHWLFL